MEDEPSKAVDLTGGARVPNPRGRAAAQPWVVRTSRGDRMSQAARLATSWPLLRMWSVRQVQLRYRQSVLGWAWTVAQPVAIMAIYGFVLTSFLDVARGDVPYLAMAWSGLTVWMYVQAALQQGTVSLRNDAWILSKVWFPREVVPLAPVVAGLVDLAVAGLILLGIAVVQGVGLSVHLVAAPLPLVVLLTWCAAISMLAGTITVFVRDMATIVALGMRLAFIATPIMYPIEVVPEHLRYLVTYNPFAMIVEGVRATVLEHRWPDWGVLAAHGVVGAALLVLALAYLRSVERRMIDII